MSRPLRTYLGCLLIVMLFFAAESTFAVGNTPTIIAASKTGSQQNAKSQLDLSEAEKSWMTEHKNIRVAFDGHFPPYSFLNDQDEFEGLAVDVMQMLADRTGIIIELSRKSVWKDLYEAAQRREVDVVATMGHRPEREEWFAFTRPYIFKSLVIVTREDTTAIDKPEDLAGKSVALVEDYQYVKPILQKYPSIRPYYVDTMLDGLNAVAVGKADAVITFLGVGDYLQAKHQLANLKFAAVFERDRFTESVAVRKDWPELASILDKALASITDDEMAGIGRRWAGPEYESSIPVRTVLTYLAAIFGVVLFLVSVFVAWNKALKRQVSLKTRELRESEERFRAIFNAANDAILIHDLETGAILDVNRKMTEMFGLSREEAMLTNVGALSSGVSPYTQEDAVGWIHKAAAGEPQLFEWQAKDKSGNLFWVEVNMSCAVIGPVERIIVSVRDISERKQAEEARQRNEQFLQIFVEHSPAAIAMFDREMKYIAVSRRFLTDYNLGEQNVVGHSHYDIFPEISERWKEIHRHCLAGAIEKSYEDPFPRADGSMDWVRWEIRPWYKFEGGIGGIILFSEMITERKQAEAALRLSEEKFAKIFRNSPDAIALTSLTSGQFVEVNESFVRLSGYSLDEIIGHTAVDLQFWVNLADRQRYINLLENPGRVTGMEVDFRKKSGEIMRSLVSGEVIEVQDNAYILTIILDISDRKQAELELEKHREHLEDLVQARTTALAESQRALLNIVEDLNQKTEELGRANAKLKELDRLKSMFIASMSHELRTPLNSIIGFSGIMLQGMSGEINDEQRDQLGRVFRSGKHLLSLITDVIDIAKIESGRITPYPEDFDLHALIDEAVGQVRQQAVAKGLAIEEHLPEHPVVMYSDRKRLLQCLLNYLSNAVKFTEKGVISISVREVNGQVEVAVKDTGIGIKQEDIPLLFGSFVRLDSHLKTATTGTGLGLYLTRKLATEVLGGMVDMESKAGEGSTFSFRVPMHLTVKAAEG